MEAEVQKRVLLAASRAGARLWRNNVGAAHMKDGSFIRYGLCNTSRALNAQFKSSDLIGVTPTLITPDMVGEYIGVFTAREVKRSTWKYSGKGREVAQQRFLNLVNGLGGNASFTTGVF